MIFGYIRVSTNEQNPDRQIKVLKEYEPNLDDKNIFVDFASGKTFNRENYLRLKDRLREGDILIIKELDRFGRNKSMVVEELKYLKDFGVIVRILNIPTTLMSFDESTSWVFELVNTILIETMASIAEEEVRRIKQRQREGIDILKAKGGYTGRKSSIDQQKFDKLLPQWRSRAITSNEFAKLLGLKSRTSLYNYMKRNNISLEQHKKGTANEEDIC